MISGYLFKSTCIFLFALNFCALSSCHSGNQANDKEKNVNTSNSGVRRIGMVIRIDSTKLKDYRLLHADSNPGVRDLLEKYNLRNFSIFLTRLDDGNYYEFGYYEYTGQNYESDMAALDAEPRNKEWLKICDPMQIPLKGEKAWKKMEKIYFNK
jgi:L-rhamnose mutarotase